MTKWQVLVTTCSMTYIGIVVYLLGTQTVQWPVLHAILVPFNIAGMIAANTRTKGSKE